MSMYADYIKEHHGDEMVETSFGFATYRYLGENQVYIVDIYVTPHMRKERVASGLADQIVAIAKKKGRTELIGSVIPSALHATQSLKVLLGYGMELLSASADVIVFRKDLT